MTLPKARRATPDFKIVALRMDQITMETKEGDGGVITGSIVAVHDNEES